MTRKKTVEEHIQEISIHGRVIYVSDFDGMSKKAKYKCLVHDIEDWGYPTTIKNGGGLKCCMLNGIKKSNDDKILEARKEYDKFLEGTGNMKRISAYVDDQTRIEHICLLHRKIHKISPNKAKSGQHLKCCSDEKRKLRGQEIIDTAGKDYDQKIAVFGKLKRIGKYQGRRKKILHICLVHGLLDETCPDSALQGSGLECCITASRQRTADKKKLTASSNYDSELEKIGKVKRIGEYIDAHTEIFHECIKHKEIHKATPHNLKAGQGLWCCKIAASREAGKKNGPLYGRFIDNVWRALLGQLDKTGVTYLYLYLSPNLDYSKYGISWNPSELLGSRGYGQALIKPRRYTYREDAVLVEQAFKFGYGVQVPPADLQDWRGKSELTQMTPEEFLEVIEDLEIALDKMGRWDFAEEFCDPEQIKIAKKNL